MFERIQRGGGFAQESLSNITEAEGLTGTLAKGGKAISNTVGLSNLIQRTQQKMLSRSAELAFFDTLGDIKAGKRVPQNTAELMDKIGWTKQEVQRIVENGPTKGDLARVYQQAVLKGTAYNESALTKPPVMADGWGKRVLRFTSTQRMLGYMTADAMRAAKARTRSSPPWWPIESLTALKPLMSR